MVVSGRAIDRWAKRWKKAYAIVPAISLAIALPFYAAFVWAPHWPLALFLLTIVMMFNYSYLSATIVVVQQETRPDQRVLAAALALLVMNFIGLGFGPTYVGAVSDFFKGQGVPGALQAAFYSLIPFYGIAIALFLVGASRLGSPFRVESDPTDAAPENA